MVNVAHMTKIQAINEMLLSIGETPVQSLDSGLQDAAIAEIILDNVNREIQAEGWHINTARSLELSKNSSNQFVLGIDVLKIDTVNPDSGRQTSTPNSSSYINAVMKRSADDTMYLLYDVDNNTETWEDTTNLTVDMVKLIDFAHLNISLQTYIYKASAHRFQKSAMGATVLSKFTQEDVSIAMDRAMQDDMETEDRNVFRNSRSAREIVYRNNPMYNT